MSSTKSSFDANFLDRWSFLLALASLVTLVTAAAGIPIQVICFFMALVGWIFFSALMFWHSQRLQADWITYLRLTLSILFLLRGATGSPLSWMDPIFAIVIFAMDGLDGYFARRQGPTYTGAIFDMEADAFFVMTLTLLSIALAKLPLWLLILPAWRYLYVLIRKGIQTFHPTALFKRGTWRGKIVCVVVLVALIFNLIPSLPYGFKLFVSCTSVLLLSASFLTDLWYDLPHEHPA